MTSHSNLKKILDEEIELLNRSLLMLDHSYNRCKEIGIKGQYDLEEYEKFEALNSRFAQTSDIFIQKLLRLIDELDLESPGTIRDRINRATKKGAIPDSDKIIDIRNLRNSIAHEYLPETVKEIFAAVLSNIPHLLEATEKFKQYCRINYD